MSGKALAAHNIMDHFDLTDNIWASFRRFNHLVDPTKQSNFMHVEQAVFSSARSSNCQGYHLVARSDGIDENIAAVLTRWSPSVGGLAPGCDESLNWFPVDEQRVALSRSVYGGPEYSRRGGLQIVTNIIVVDRQDLAGYGNDPMSLATVAMRNGWLMLRTGLKRRLDPIELPDQTALRQLDHQDETSVSFENITRAIQLSDRVALTGVQSPLNFLSSFWSQRDPQEASHWSFTSGLMPAEQRPFSLYVFNKCDQATLDSLRTKKIRVINTQQKLRRPQLTD